VAFKPTDRKPVKGHIRTVSNGSQVGHDLPNEGAKLETMACRSGQQISRSKRNHPKTEPKLFRSRDEIVLKKAAIGRISLQMHS
jgi:hypothetical protein